MNNRKGDIDELTLCEKGNNWNKLIDGSQEKMIRNNNYKMERMSCKISKLYEMWIYLPIMKEPNVSKLTLLICNALRIIDNRLTKIEALSK